MTLYEKYLNGYKFAPIENPVYYNGKQVVLLVVPGHGIRLYTPGKRSPDGSLIEGEWAREMTARMIPDLRALGFDARCLVPEDEDIHISVRAQRANRLMAEERDKAFFYLAMHINAAPGGDYHWVPGATGFTCWAARDASAFSCNWAKECVNTAREMGLLGNRYTPEEGFHRENWTEVHDTLMPAILAENLFMTDPNETKFLLSEEGKEKIETLHYIALCKVFGIPYVVKR